MTDNTQLYYVLSNISDITAIIFLMIHIAAMYGSDDRYRLPGRMVEGALMMLLGLTCRLLARTLTQTMMTGGLEFSQGSLQGLRIVGFILISISMLTLFNSLEALNLSENSQVSIPPIRSFVVWGIIIAAGIVIYLITGSDRIWSVVVLMIIACGCFRNVRMLAQVKQRIALFILAMATGASFVVVLLIPDLRLTGAWGALLYVAAYIQYAFSLQMEYARKEQELAESRIRLLTGQISPHFMFNSLQVIQGLCDTDPGNVKSAIGMFASYLRGNLESLTSEKLIPFNKELEHTRAYLSLEQLGGGRSFTVEYKLAVTNFLMPPLTLQPLVENAVRYGIGTASEGEVIVIETSEDSDAIYISVTDNGHGRVDATYQQKNKRSVGTDNVRARLESQCGGSLSVNITDTGTTAVIELPKNTG